MPSASWVIRRAVAADLPAIVALLEEAELPLDGLGRTLLWVAERESGSQPTGVVGLEVHGSDGLLRSVAVRDYLRRTGVGGGLVAHAVAAAREEGLARLWALTVTADAFLERCGFAPSSREALPDAVAASPEVAVACPAGARVHVLDL